MCGIVAYYGMDFHNNLKPMLEKVHHRGPDEDSLDTFGNLHLGHKRLSIIGPDSGRQPIPNETGDLNVVANGEIYNHRKLRQRLPGHVFSTASDSEVIVHLYEEMGLACVKELDGMFAFVLSDRGKPFAARDTLGIKPLYMAEDGNGIYFASEIKSLIEFTDNITEFPPGHYYTPETGIQPYRRLETTFCSLEQWHHEDLKAIKSSEELHNELFRSIKALHNINLQRLDRMTMAHSVEGRVSFLDLEMVSYAASLPPELKLWENSIEKWILRKAFEGYLPDEIIWREKIQFAEGCGSDRVIQELVEDQISDREFNRDRQSIQPALRSKEELYYYRLFKQYFNSDKVVDGVGRWATA